jgi:hypothetical protein
VYRVKKDAQAAALDAVEVHLGCRIIDIVKAPRHVICGGLITLYVFPRGNAAHKKFLKECRVDSRMLTIVPHS